MTPEKTKEPPNSTAQPAAQTVSGRKPWVKRTPVQVVLKQIEKQESRVSDLRDELKKEERELAKLQQAKKIFES